ncbi:MAG: TfoX/Sxy family protein [Pseudonocardiales bacterium]|nr:TfoX/Sxy family protein [Pseudonocardiales bacterium]
MAYDEDIANRIREVVSGEAGVTEKRMFGGLAFLINGNMSVSASGRGGILLRVDPAETEALIAAPHAERAVMGGRSMDGWLRVDIAAVPDDEVDDWIARGVTYARSLPAK